jgi:hypothetical protein
MVIPLFYRHKTWHFILFIRICLQVSYFLTHKKCSSWIEDLKYMNPSPLSISAHPSVRCGSVNVVGVFPIAHFKILKCGCPNLHEWFWIAGHLSPLYNHMPRDFFNLELRPFAFMHISFPHHFTTIWKCLPKLLERLQIDDINKKHPHDIGHCTEIFVFTLPHPQKKNTWSSPRNGRLRKKNIPPYNINC